MLLGELPAAAGLSRARKPLALPVAVVVGQPGVEVARAKPTSARTHEAIEGSARSDAEPHQAEKANSVMGAARRLCRRSIPRRQSPSARHESGCGRRRSNERPPGRAAVHRGRCSRFCQSVPVADPDQSLKAPKATNPETRVPLGVRAVLGRAASGGKRRLWQGRAASCAQQASVEKKKHHAAHDRPYRLLLRACRNPAPLVGMCAARLMPGLAKPHPRGKTGTGFATLSGK